MVNGEELGNTVGVIQGVLVPQPCIGSGISWDFTLASLVPITVDGLVRFQSEQTVGWGRQVPWRGAAAPG